MPRSASIPLQQLNSSLSVPDTGTWRVDLKDPARSVMTDFHERGMVTVEPTAQVDVALEVMKHAGVRSVFVVEKERGRVVGLLTAYDVMGEKPVRYLQAMGGTYRSMARHEVLAKDIMEPVEEWLVARLEDVDDAAVESILDSLERTRRTHIAVVEGPVGGERRLRGIFSAAKILRLTREARLRSNAAPTTLIVDLPVAVIPGPPPSGA